MGRSASDSVANATDHRETGFVPIAPMTNSNDMPVDPLERARLLEQVHAAVLAGDRAPHEPRSVVVESWRRSLDAHINPDRWEPPVSFDTGQLDDVRNTHPLAAWVPLLSRTLLDAADGTTHIMIVTDADGNILWRRGHPQVCRDADNVLLAEGTRWAESAIGTNAMGTTLATGAPVQIHSAEHLVRTYHSWTCAACPVHDPETGKLLGAIDLSGPLHTMHPALLALVVTSAHLVESQLRLHMNAKDELFRERHAHHLTQFQGDHAALLSASGRIVASEPHSWLAQGDQILLDPVDGKAVLDNGEQAEVEAIGEGYLLRMRRDRSTTPPRSKLSLRLMGDGVPTATVDGVTHELTLRHAEILTLLALHPGGLTAERLALLLHGEQGNATTVRVEIHRIRNTLGNEVVRTKPYRIAAELDSDLDAVREAVRRGKVADVADQHGCLLLPRSESLAIREEREELFASLRCLVLASGDADLLWRFVRSEAGHDDLEALETLLEWLPADAPHRDSVATRLRRLAESEA
jgi:hypothetical protein